MHARVSDAGLSQELAGVVPLLYRSLGALAPAEAAVARGLLAGSRCVWVGNGFAPAGRVAFKVRVRLGGWGALWWDALGGASLSFVAF